MTLNDVPVEAPVHEHTALEVHKVAHLQCAEVGALKCFLYCGNGVGAIAREFHHCEAYAIVRNRLVDFQLIDKRASEREMQIAIFFFECDNCCRLFNYSGEHIRAVLLTFCEDSNKFCDKKIAENKAC